jgi:hypothetical protein
LNDRLFGLLPLVKLDGEAMFEADTIKLFKAMSTPVSRYRNRNGYNLPTCGEMIWNYRMAISSMENCKSITSFTTSKQ